MTLLIRRRSANEIGIISMWVYLHTFWVAGSNLYVTEKLTSHYQKAKPRANKWVCEIISVNYFTDSVNLTNVSRVKRTNHRVYFTYQLFLQQPIRYIMNLDSLIAVFRVLCSGNNHFRICIPDLKKRGCFSSPYFCCPAGHSVFRCHTDRIFLSFQGTFCPGYQNV